MRKSVEQMKKDIIEKFGFESKETIKFFYTCEKYSKRTALIEYMYRRIIEQKLIKSL